MHVLARIVLATTSVLTVLLASTGIASAGMSTPGPSHGATDGLILPPRASLAKVREVFVLGDSLTVGTLQYGDPSFLRSAAGSRGLVLTPAPSARVGRKVSEGMQVLARTARVPATVLVALGTNDLGSSPRSAAAWVQSVRRIVGTSTTIYWVNLSMSGARFATGMRGVNAGLLAGVQADIRLQAAAGRSGTSRILDWHQFCLDRHLANSRDGVHYPLPGYQLRAAFYAGALSGDSGYAGYVRG